MELSNGLGPWVYFFTGLRTETLEAKTIGIQGLKNVYIVKEIVSVTGSNFVKMEPNWHVARIETTVPLSEPHTIAAELKAMAGHLQYTSQEVRQELAERSAKECAAGDRTVAVLIPIRKSREWWSQAQDERQTHFRKPVSGHNHTSIGYQYAARIYRKLYHCRYLGAVSDYDFLTYFEFDETDTGMFKQLLSDLRNVHHNPEWKFVDRECEIWMSKINSFAGAGIGSAGLR